MTLDVGEGSSSHHIFVGEGIPYWNGSDIIQKMDLDDLDCPYDYFIDLNGEWIDYQGWTNDKRKKLFTDYFKSVSDIKEYIPSKYSCYLLVNTIVAIEIFCLVGLKPHEFI